MTEIFVIDTSYLLELFAVPDASDPSAVEEVRRRYRDAVAGDARLFVPLPCLFELANHIVDVRDGSVSHRLANHLTKQVRASIEDDGEWTLVPLREAGHFPRLWDRFAQEFARQGVGLTDTCVIEEARRLKRERYGGSLFTVHIWTRDQALKAYEPVREEDPFVR